MKPLPTPLSYWIGRIKKNNNLLHMVLRKKTLYIPILEFRCRRCHQYRNIPLVRESELGLA